MRSSDLERVAETHFTIRPILTSALKNQVLTKIGQEQFKNCQTYNEVWTSTLSDRYFDMGTLIRAAASVETGLRDFYLQKMGYANLTELRGDIKYKQNIFQRVMPGQGEFSAIELFKSISIDLLQVSDFSTVQELVLHRHLYAHNLGVIDDKYIDDLKKLTGNDIRKHPEVLNIYPDKDVIWFEPLNRLNTFIEGARTFLRELK